MRLEEAIYHAFNNTRGVGGTVCPKSWMDLPKVERKRWIRIAKAIATRFAPRKVVWPEERFSAKRNSAERDFGFDVGRTACIKAYEDSRGEV